MLPTDPRFLGGQLGPRRIASGAGVGSGAGIAPRRYGRDTLVLLVATALAVLAALGVLQAWHGSGLGELCLAKFDGRDGTSVAIVAGETVFIVLALPLLLLAAALRSAPDAPFDRPRGSAAAVRILGRTGACAIVAALVVACAVRPWQPEDDSVSLLFAGQAGALATAGLAASLSAFGAAWRPQIAPRRLAAATTMVLVGLGLAFVAGLVQWVVGPSCAAPVSDAGEARDWLPTARCLWMGVAVGEALLPLPTVPLGVVMLLAARRRVRGRMPDG